MVSKRAEPAHRKRSERWKTIVKAYRNRHRMWTMENLPTMAEGEWKQYLQWVADFGGTNQRKLKRQMAEARPDEVTATVTTMGELGSAFHEAMQKKPGGARTTRMIINFGQAKAIGRIYKDAPRRNSVTMLPSAGATRRQ